MFALFLKTLLVLTASASSPVSNSEKSVTQTPTKTFYVKILGDQTIGNRLLEKLSEKECHSSGDRCHSFKKFEDKSQIQGALAKAGSSVLYQINITHRDGVDRYNLQIFQRDGRSMRRVVNAGNFTPQEFQGYKNRKITDEEFFTHLTKSTMNITFK